MRHKILTMLIGMLLLCGILSYLNVTVKASYTTHDPIIIEGNDDFTSANGVSNPSAAGTADDPYIIKEWGIVADEEYPISISNTDAHFKIVDCTFSSTTGMTVGIILQNVSGGIITNCFITEHMVGIYLISSSNNQIKNCIISDNSLSFYGETFGFGLMIQDSSNNNITYCNISNNPSGVVISDSSNNHIHHNNFISNDNHSLTEDLNTTSSNYWDDGSEGNYWDDYTGTGDTPYVLSDSEQDGYPFTSPVENAGIAGFTRPLKAEFSYTPETPEINETIYFTDESSDPSGGTIVSWYWDFGDGSISTEQNPTHQYESEDYYTVNLTVTNDNGEEATTSEWLMLYDESSENQKPTVTITSPESGATIEKGEVVTIEGTASDLDGLLLSVEVKIGGSNWIEADLTDGIWSYIWNTTGLPSGSQVTIYAKASDLYGEYNETYVQITIQSGGSGGTPGFEVAVLLIAVLLVSLFSYRKRR